ncbi:MAG: phospholipase D-like domain-containing protein, partial [Hyphomicrobium sp.]|nr:phospholipase D-like domain-containing protein [Hyphomicrobium sp.]
MSKAPTATRNGAPRSAQGEPRETSVAGNRLSLLPDGPERLEALIGLIDGAKQSLRLLYYIYTPDAAGERVRDAILAAVNRGVEVALLLDGFGSASTPHDYFDPVFGGGGRYCRFHPSYGRRYLLRNHQKMALADAETPDCKVMIGGFNIADDYFMADGPKAWRDLALIVAGPAA